MSKETSVFQYITALMVFLNQHPECIHMSMDDALAIMEKEKEMIAIDFPDWGGAKNEKDNAKDKWKLLAEQFNDQLEEIYAKDSKTGLDTLKTIREAMIEFAVKHKAYQKKFAHFQDEFNKAKIVIAKRQKI